MADKTQLLEVKTNELLRTREVRVFISSTFLDMTEERNHLTQLVFPRIRDHVYERMINVVDLDLRWGISKKDSRSTKIIDICMDEIIRCRPFFLGLLGNRYGWIPDDTQLDDFGLLKQKYPWITQQMLEGKSITEMEFYFGALADDADTNASFFIKDTIEGTFTGNEQEWQKLNRLKQQLDSQTRYPVFHYTTLEEFGKKVELQILAYIDKCFPPQKHEEPEVLKEKMAFNKLVYLFSGRENELRQIDRFITGSDDNCMVIAGEHGVGKSALLAHWYQTRKDQYNIYYHLPERDNNNICYSHIEEAIEELSRRYGWNIPEKMGSDDGFLIEFLIRADRPVVLILDYNSSYLKYILDKFDEPLPNVKILCTDSWPDSSYEDSRKENKNQVTLKDLDKDSIKKIAKQYLNDFGKNPEQHHIDKIAANALAGTPLILKDMLNELKLYGSFHSLDSFVDELTENVTYSAFYKGVISRLHASIDILSRDFPLISNTSVVDRILSHLLNYLEVDGESVSYFRSKENIIEITAATDAEWNRIYYAIRDYLSVNTEGSIFISNDYFEKTIGDSCSAALSVEAYHKRIHAVDLNKVDLLYRLNRMDAHEAPEHCYELINNYRRNEVNALLIEKLAQGNYSGSYEELLFSFYTSDYLRASQLSGLLQGAFTEEENLNIEIIKTICSAKSSPVTESMREVIRLLAKLRFIRHPFKNELYRLLVMTNYAELYYELLEEATKENLLQKAYDYIELQQLLYDQYVYNERAGKVKEEGLRAVELLEKEYGVADDVHFGLLKLRYLHNYNAHRYFRVEQFARVFEMAFSGLDSFSCSELEQIDELLKNMISRIDKEYGMALQPLYVEYLRLQKERFSFLGEGPKGEAVCLERTVELIVRTQKDTDMLDTIEKRFVNLAKKNPRFNENLASVYNLLVYHYMDRKNIDKAISAYLKGYAMYDGLYEFDNFTWRTAFCTYTYNHLRIFTDEDCVEEVPDGSKMFRKLMRIKPDTSQFESDWLYDDIALR